MSLIDTTLDKRQPFDAKWPIEDLRSLRRAMEYLIFVTIAHQLAMTTRSGDSHLDMLECLYDRDHEPRIVSLNYDILIDNAMIAFAESVGRTPMPWYQADISSRAYRRVENPFGYLLKLHGSLNWYDCPACHRLGLSFSEKAKTTSKAIYDLFGPDGDFESEAPMTTEQYFQEGARACYRCDTAVQPVLVSPTHRKDYRNPHLAATWHEAERQLRKATRIVVIGYSLPDDDIDVIYMLKRALSRKQGVGRPRLEVVQYAGPGADLSGLKQKYAHLFGTSDFTWHDKGFEAWVESLPRA